MLLPWNDLNDSVFSVPVLASAAANSDEDVTLMTFRLRLKIMP